MNKRYGYILAVAMFGGHAAFADQGRYVVAKSGGDFTTINAALAQGSNCSYPTVIDILPGVYNEDIRLTGANACTHLRGAGMDLTTIGSVGGQVPIISMGVACVSCPTPTAITISGVTVRGTGTQGGISATYGILTLSDSRVTSTTNATSANYGTMIVRNSVLEGNVNGAIASYGSMHIESNVIRNNTGIGVYGARYVVDNLIYANGTGLRLTGQSSSPSTSDNISGNTIVDNTGDGIYIESAARLIIKNNKITNNIGYDINVLPGISSNLTVLAFNTYDRIVQGSMKATYNIKSNGTLW
jgi:parallel beta-helix repeat protein